MRRMGEIDLPDRLAPGVPVWVTQVVVGILCALGGGVIRLLFDLVAPGTAPFALVFPALIMATLFARWPAGVLTAIISIRYASRFVLVKGGVTAATLADPTGIQRTLVVSAAAGITIVIAEGFRRAVRNAAAERDREIADRDLFLAEFDHRMKNNFAIVAGLLDMQKRRAEEPATVAALETARMRVESIAQAHRHLYRGSGDRLGAVEIRDYLRELCGALAEALFLGGKVTLVCEADAGSLPRDRAVSIGLIVNELVTNAAKHAFAGRDTGRIDVMFRDDGDDGWLLRVADNGVGLPVEAGVPGTGHGLGTRLIDAFARQAEATITTESSPSGTSVTLVLSA